MIFHHTAGSRSLFQYHKCNFLTLYFNNVVSEWMHDCCFRWRFFSYANVRFRKSKPINSDSIAGKAHDITWVRHPMFWPVKIWQYFCRFSFTTVMDASCTVFVVSFYRYRLHHPAKLMSLICKVIPRFYQLALFSCRLSLLYREVKTICDFRIGEWIRKFDSGSKEAQ